MALKLRDDPDLQVLQFAESRTLGHLVRHLTFSDSGQVRIAQSLLSEPRFKNVGEQYNKVWDLIGAELQSYGGNTLVNVFRGKGVTYREILMDVCSGLWLHVDAAKSTVQLEEDLLSSLHQILWIADIQKNGKTPAQPVEAPKAFSEEVEQRVRDDLSIALRLGKWMPSYISALRHMLILDELKRRSLLIPIAGGAGKLLSNFFSASLIPDVTGSALAVKTPAIFFIAYLRRNLDQDVY